MKHTQYIEIIINKLCTSVDSQFSVPDSQAHESLYDATQHTFLTVSQPCYYIDNGQVTLQYVSLMA